MDADEFEAVKSEFEDPTAAVRLLLATDAASEGINMQECCRWIIHYDVPWSPSKLQQRNGRVSRHGQVRDVSVYYFRCDQEEDLTFLLKVAKKVEQVREDLGSVERVFNAAIQRHFQGKTTPFDRLSDLVDQQIAISPERTTWANRPPPILLTLTTRAKELLESTETRLGISSQALIDILRSRRCRRRARFTRRNQRASRLLPPQAAATLGRVGPADPHRGITHRPHGTGI